MHELPLKGKKQSCETYETVNQAQPKKKELNHLNPHFIFNPDMDR